MMKADKELATKILEHEGLGYAVLDYYGKRGPVGYELPVKIWIAWQEAYANLEILLDYFAPLLEDSDDDER